MGEARRRRTFAVIGHPDAGKSTLITALARHARVLSAAGTDWMESERAHGTSMTSAALQFAYGDTVINLLDTSGNADSSVDTYRVLSAVDSAVMLLDAAQGLEPQTLNLFDFCRQQGIPVITFITKWDRPGREALRLCDELTDRIGVQPMPLTWPVGIAGHLRGVVDVPSGKFVPYRPAKAHQNESDLGADWVRAQEEVELLYATGGEFDESRFLAVTATPVLFGTAVCDFGVRHLLDSLAELAPRPAPRTDTDGEARALDAPFSAFVFKVQTRMDPARRDQVAFARVCSGVFKRGMIVTHATTGKPFATKYAQKAFGHLQSRDDSAYPGDVIGLADAPTLRVGDTVYTGRPPVHFPSLPGFISTRGAIDPAQ
ncbi:peptide chain release factor 3 [Amycolatopsis sp. WAC 04182]|nr:peptide chain release factor 3 [Amycolatopsis sp. WAC 04182]